MSDSRCDVVPHHLGSGPEMGKRYLSCIHIERGMVLNPKRITACCANPNTGRTPGLAPFTTDVTAEQIADGRKNIIQDHKAGDIREECVGCPRLTDYDWEAYAATHAEPAIVEITLAHFSTCNIFCNYCYTVQQPKHMAAPLSKAPKTLRMFQGLIQNGQISPNATVRFSGGEPTISPEFEDVLTLLSDHGCRSIVYTNAVKRSDAIVRALKMDRVGLVVGIDAASREVYMAIKERDYLDRVWTNLAIYTAAHRPQSTNQVWAKFIFCEENYEEALTFVELASAAGARGIYYDFDASKIKARGAPKDLPEAVPLRAAQLVAECERRGLEVAFAQSGFPWFTPERQSEFDAELQRLRSRQLVDIRISAAETGSVLPATH